MERDVNEPRGLARLDAGDRLPMHVLAIVTWMGSGVVAVLTLLHAASWFMLAEPTFPMDTTGPAITEESWSAAVTSVDVTAAIGGGARTLFAVSDILSLAGAVAVAGVGFLFFTLARGAWFGRSLTVVAAIVGPVLAVGGMLQSAAWFAATAIAYEDLGRPEQLIVSSPIPVGQIVLGLVVAAMAYMFSRGARLERDTAGLV